MRVQCWLGKLDLLLCLVQDKGQVQPLRSKVEVRGGFSPHRVKRVSC